MDANKNFLVGVFDNDEIVINAVACHIENNVAVVGREEVINRRDMHWLRIDRYYSSNAEIGDRLGLEEAADNPEVVFQPMLCQHCNNAPCETVCPVAATTHSTEGVNQMTYNRCIGTRYCANNCVMEKCSFCVQRIQAGKLTAKKEKRELKDGDVVTACQASCSTGAIVFGDMNDPESKISKLLKVRPLYPERPTINHKESDNPRAYNVLEEIDVRPNIYYLMKVRNKDGANA